MYISPFLDKKLARRFKTYDLDGNGYIEQQDFENAVINVCTAFGHTPDSAPWQQLHTLLMALGEALLRIADADQDGRISEAEYKQAFAQGMLETPASFDQGYLPYLAANMAIMDADGDGKINEQEYTLWANVVVNLPTVYGHENFRRLDQDGDGLITSHDLLEAIREYYFNEDPQSSGSWLLGPLASE